MKLKQISYITLMPVGDSDFKCYCETISGGHYEFTSTVNDSLSNILEKLDDAQSPTEKKLEQVMNDLQTKTDELIAKDDKLSKTESERNQLEVKVKEKDDELLTTKNQIKEKEDELATTKNQIKEKEETFNTILDNLMAVADWSKLNFVSFEEACSKAILLKVGDGVRYNNQNYIIKVQHTPKPNEVPEERKDLYFPLKTKVKEKLIELTQGQKYAKGTIGSFRGTVYRCEVDNNTAPIGTPGYWTNLGPVSNYK